jgi:hypothetical protein
MVQRGEMGVSESQIGKMEVLDEAVDEAVVDLYQLMFVCSVCHTSSVRLLADVGIVELRRRRPR